MASGNKDPYTLHRAALAPLLPGTDAATLALSCQQANGCGEQTFIQFLLEQGLGPLWDEKIQHYKGDLPLSQSARDIIHQSRMHATGNYLLQRNSLSKTREILEQAGVPHAVLKGAHTRERYYDQPALRPATDQDVLIPNEFDTVAIEALQRAGFTFYGVASNISHECSLEKGGTSVDLHWDILRPGRTRIPMAETILNNRQDYGSHWGSNDEATLFMLLVHPVFTKYLTAPQATLVRQLDLVYLMQRGTPDWTTVVHWLDASGLKTAAWLSLAWLALLTGIRTPEEVMSRLRPGPLRARYLRGWLERNMSTRWLDRPGLIQIGFTLAAHDTWRDIFRATRVARSCRGTGTETLEALEKVLAERYHSDSPSISPPHQNH